MAGNNSAHTGSLPARTIHLYPSRFCNLVCRHCYSESGPHMRSALPPELVVQALGILRTEGYELLNLSGGEPLLYLGFETVVRAAIALGFRIQVVTNGTPVFGRMLDLLAECADLVLVSLDGSPATHARIRDDVQAFVRAEQAMERLAERGVRYGIAYCVSRESLADMPWAVEFASAKGASLVQFQPFAPLGRGQQLAGRLSLDAAAKARAYVTALLLDQASGAKVRIGLLPAATARAQSSANALPRINARTTALADLVNPLVIDEMGRLLPLSYGIDRQLLLAKLGPELARDLGQYKAEGWPQLQSLIDAACTGVELRGEHFVDWHYQIVSTSRTTYQALAVAR